MYIAKNPAGTVFLDDHQDPALLNATYFPSLTAALMRLKVRYAGQPTERAALVDGIRDIILTEHQFGALESDLPTEDEIARDYLLRHDWQHADTSPYGQFVDPINGRTVDFLNACERQGERDTRDYVAELTQVQEACAPGPQEPPQDYRIFNRRRPDGTFPPLADFFDGAVAKADGQTLEQYRAQRDAAK